MDSKQCSKCHQVKVFDDFYNNAKNKNGKHSACKDCYYKYYSKTESHKASIRLWNKTHKDSVYKAADAWKARNPEKDAAEKILRRQVALGNILKKTCYKCSATRTHAHHEDYTKPLDVIWCCAFHHKEIHRNKRSKI